MKKATWGLRLGSVAPSCPRTPLGGRWWGWRVRWRRSPAGWRGRVSGIRRMDVCVAPIISVVPTNTTTAAIIMMTYLSVRRNTTVATISVGIWGVDTVGIYGGWWWATTTTGQLMSSVLFKTLTSTEILPFPLGIRKWWRWSSCGSCRCCRCGSGCSCCGGRCWRRLSLCKITAFVALSLEYSQENNMNEWIKVGLGIRILIHIHGEKNGLWMTMMKWWLLKFSCQCILVKL